MKFILSPDSFKGSISSKDAALSLEKGIKNIIPEAVCTVIPIADGGEGTLDALINEEKGDRLVSCEVTSTDRKKVNARFGIRKNTAIIEMASCAGLTLVKEEDRDPMTATTYGVGELVIRALDTGCRNIILTVGGSGTNDCGSGMFCALGGKIFDSEGNRLCGDGESICKAARIDISSLDARLYDCKFTIASDVKNTLTGKEGATFVFGPQKGVTEEMKPILEAGMKNFASLLENASGKRVSDVAGSGAGGGIIAPLLSFFNTEVRSGIDSVLDAADFDSSLENADAVVSGEGRIDSQSLFGKAISGVASRTMKKNIPLYLAAGIAGEGYEEIYSLGVKKIFFLKDEIPFDIRADERPEYSMKNAGMLLEKIGEKIAADLRHMKNNQSE